MAYHVTSPSGYCPFARPALPAICRIWLSVREERVLPSNLEKVVNTTRRMFLTGEKGKRESVGFIPSGRRRGRGKRDSQIKSHANRVRGQQDICPHLLFVEILRLIGADLGRQLAVNNCAGVLPFGLNLGLELVQVIP